MSWKPLNPMLYARLANEFGRVIIGNPGVALPRPVSVIVNPLTGARRREHPKHVEHYRVRCPYCRDHKPRLNVAYFWGQLDEEHEPIRHAVNCFNEDCLSDKDNFLDFVERMSGLMVARRQPKIDPTSSAGRIETASLPGECVRVDAMTESSPAIDYLLMRRFNLRELGQKYDIRVCLNSYVDGVTGRIVCPVFHRGRVVGWQARYPGELRWKEAGVVKYRTMTGLHTSQVLYNLDRARTWTTIVVMEGVTDVWRFGSCGVASFGKALSGRHIQLLRRANPDAVVLLYDFDGQKSESVLRSIASLRRAFGKKFVNVVPPPNVDPGASDRDFIREFVRVQAAKSGVKVVYRLREEVGDGDDSASPDVAAELAGHAAAGA